MIPIYDFSLPEVKEVYHKFKGVKNENKMNQDKKKIKEIQAKKKK